MTKYQIYLLLHLCGILLLFFAYGSLITRALLARAAAGNAKATTLPGGGLGGRKAGAIASGIGLLLILVSGFGLIAYLKLGWPLWVLIKIGIWVVLAAMVGILNRKPHLSPLMWIVTLLLGFAAVAAVIIRPAL